MGAIVNWLSGLSGPLVYAVVGALVFFEDALFVGFVLPGETAVVLAGVLANQGHVSLWGVMSVVVFAAIVGDSVGYAIGNHFGDRILDVKPLRRHQENLGKAKAMMRDRGAAAVFFGRFIAFFRAVMPALAGISHMPYRKFLLFNALGGLVWGVGYTLLGYFAGQAYKRVEAQAGKWVAIAIAVIVVAVIGVFAWRRHRRERDG
ncbi:DedA family protein [Streptacidiphilus sp. MAP5-3]|uniref:DedA family protein n=1 Tax=unclassified Streptacidiphilus TaxID=2643834 RepID=UPI0035156A2B